MPAKAYRRTPKQIVGLTESAKRDAGFLSLDECLELLPIELPRKRAFIWSNSGRFPRIIRVFHRESDPMVDADEFLTWLKLSFQEELPGVVARIERTVKQMLARR